MFSLRRLAAAVVAVLLLVLPGRADVKLMALDARNSEIVTIDPTNGQVVNRVSVDPSIQSVTYDSVRGTLYGLSYKPSQPVELVKINRRTGKEIVVGTLSSRVNVGLINNPQGIAADPHTGKLYVTPYRQEGGVFVSEQLCTIDVRTAALSPVGEPLSWDAGSLNLPPPDAIATDSSGHVWVSASSGDPSGGMPLWKVDAPRGEFEKPAWSAPQYYFGMAFEPWSAMMWVLGYDGNRGTSLLQLNTSTGQLSTIGEVDPHSFLLSLTVVPGDD